MKKLMTLMLGVALLTGTVTTVFGQEPKKEKKKGGKKKKSDDKTDKKS